MGEFKYGIKARSRSTLTDARSDDDGVRVSIGLEVLLELGFRVSGLNDIVPGILAILERFHRRARLWEWFLVSKKRCDSNPSCKACRMPSWYLHLSRTDSCWTWERGHTRLPRIAQRQCQSSPLESPSSRGQGGGRFCFLLLFLGVVCKFCEVRGII